MALFLGMSIETPTLQEGLEAIIVELAKKNRVVVLVDEYDNAIINNLKDPEIKAFQGGNVGKLGIIRGKLVIRFLS